MLLARDVGPGGVVGRSGARYHPRPRVAAALTLTSRGNEWMNKSEIAGRLANPMALSRSAATGAVDAVFETIDEALAQGEEVG